PLTGVQEWILDRVVRGWNPSKGPLGQRFGARFSELKRLVRQRNRREKSAANPEDRPSLAGEGNAVTARASTKGGISHGGKSALGSTLGAVNAGRGDFVAPAAPVPDRDRKPGKGRPRKARPERDVARGLWKPVGAGALIFVGRNPRTGRAQYRIGPGVDDPVHKGAVRDNDPRIARSVRASKGHQFGDPSRIVERQDAKQPGNPRDVLRRRLEDTFGEGLDLWVEQIDASMSRRRVAGQRRQDQDKLIEAAADKLPADAAAALRAFWNHEKKER
ncbi:MAG: hypothetical protein ACRDTD_13490, partial [Pseudonocardiaceae bacterium]